jgi:hypothetical protein
MVESRGMKVTEARSSTIVAGMGRVVCTMTVGFNKRRQRLLRVNYTVGFWTGDWKAFFYDMYMDLGIELARAQFLAAMHIKKNDPSAAAASSSSASASSSTPSSLSASPSGSSSSLASSSSAPSKLSSSSSATSIVGQEDGDSPFPGMKQIIVSRLPE